MKKHKCQLNKNDRLNPKLIRYLNLVEGWSLAEIGRLFDGVKTMDSSKTKET